ncbi:MAG: response regulator [Eubacterium sp.]|nr:response regulator [Eubacterium sp.]
MIQKNYHIDGDFTTGFYEIIEDASFQYNYNNNAETLLIIYEKTWDEKKINLQRELIARFLPDALFFGTTSFSSVGVIAIEPVLKDETDICVLFFESKSAEVKLYDYEKYKNESDFGDAIGSDLAGVHHLKGVMTFISGLYINCDTVTDHIGSLIPEEVPIFGATSASIAMDFGERDIRENVSYVYDASGVYKKGAAIAAFYGLDLHLYATYNYGWTPVGQIMTITGMDSNYYVTEIDGRPAAEIYQKYLGLPPGQITPVNSCEFPLIIDREGLTVARIPVGCDDKGTLFFSAPLKTGEKVRFSYGLQMRIFSEIYEDSMAYLAFGPQAMFLTVCGNRIAFLKDQETHEIDFYKKICPSLTVVHGSSEIYHSSRRGGDLNSALVAVGIREGEPVSVEINDEDLMYETFSEELERSHGAIPLEFRLMNFMEAVTGDLIEMTRLANAANEAKSAFLSNMTHELRSPINAVLGMDEMVIRESDQDSVIDYAENIKTAGNSLLSLINDVLDMSKIEAGKMSIVDDEYQTASIVNDLVTLISGRAEDKGLELILDIDPTLPSAMVGDEVRIKQVITNILTNAVKYTEKGSVTLSIRIVRDDDEDSVAVRSVSGEPHEVIIEVHVKDTGIGIRQEDIGKLFAKFERIEEKRNKNIEGTGLGMSITTELLALMGSRLEVSSVYGEGSDFYFSLRQRVANDTPMGDYEEALRKVRANRKRYQESFTAPDARILVADDTPMNLLVIQNLLKKTMVNIDTCESGMEVLDVIKKERYDLIFLDDRMPTLTGVETLERMRETDHLNGEVPVIILTANSADDAKSFYMDKGFTDYLSKPIDPMILEDQLKKYLPEEKIHPAGEETSAEAVPRVLADEEAPAGSVQAADGTSPTAPSQTAYETSPADDDFMISTRDLYLDSLADNACELKSLYESEDWENYTIKVHALKSTSRIIGEEGLGSLAERMEAAGDGGDISFIKAHHTELINWYQSLYYKYRGILPDSLMGGGYQFGTEPGQHKADGNPGDLSGADISNNPIADERPEIPIDQLEEVFAAIHEYAKEFDDEAIENLLEPLKGYRIPDEAKERYDQIVRDVNRLNWDRL